MPEHDLDAAVERLAVKLYDDDGWARPITDAGESEQDEYRQRARGYLVAAAPPFLRNDSAVEVLAERLYNDQWVLEGRPSLWPIWSHAPEDSQRFYRDVARGHLTALPHLQDQGLRELAEFVERERESASRTRSAASAHAHGSSVHYAEGQVQAFRAVQSEIERRIGEGRDG